MKKSSLAVNYFYSLMYQFINVIVSVLTTPYISRRLGANAIGAYSFCFSITNYFLLFGTFGFNMYGQIAISKCRNDEEKTNVIFWNIFISKIITSILSIAVYGLFVFLYKDYMQIFAILVIALIANMYDISWFFQGLEEFKFIAIRNSIIKLASLLCIFAFVKDAGDIYKYIIILHTSTCLGNLALFSNLGKRIHKMDLSTLEVKSYILKSIPFFIPAIITSVFSVADKVMIGFILNSEYQSGIYEQAHKIEQTLITIISSLSSVMLPRMTFYASNNNDDQFNKNLQYSISFIGMISVPMAFGLCGIAPTLVPVFLGDEFLESTGILQIFSFILVFSGLNTLIGNQCLVAKGRQATYNTAVALSAVLNLILNYLFICKWKAIGAAIATLISEMTILTLFMHSCRDELKIVQILKCWKNYIIISVPMMIILHFVSMNFSPSIFLLLAELFCSVAYYFVALFALGDHFVFRVLDYLKRKICRNYNIR